MAETRNVLMKQCPRAWQALACLGLLLLLAGCALMPVRNPLARWVPSPNFNARQPILIVIHATEQDSVEQALRTLRTFNRGGKVSAHYLIGSNGDIYQLVADKQRAWHAGAGSWGTITDVNSASIGIELDHNGSVAFADAQIQSLLRLLADVCARYDIPRTQVIGHADMAPTRKHDPGARFPWATLAAAGFGRWPSQPLQDPPPEFDGLSALRLLGYPMSDPQAAIRAFRLHFRGLESDTPGLEADDRRVLFALTAESP